MRMPQRSAQRMPQRSPQRSPPQTILLFFSLLAIVAGFFSPSFASAITDSDFEAAVLAQNVELRVLSERRKVLKDSAEEAELLYGWQLFAGLNRRVDQKPRIDPSFTFDSLDTLSTQVGLQKRFSFGLETKFSFDAAQTKIVGGRAAGNAFDVTVWETTPSVELKMPLLSGGFGRKIRADYTGLVAQRQIEALNAEAEYDRKMNEARTIFWSTILQRAALENQRETLARIQKIYEVVRSKTSLNLEASSNFLQTRSALEQAEFDLQSARLRFDQLERLLKLVLTQSPTAVVPDYDFTKFKQIQLSDFEKKITAEEKLSFLTEKSQQIAAISREEDAGAKLDLVASYTANGQNERFSDSFSQSQRSRYPTTFVGLQFSVPLDPALTSRAVNRQSELVRLSADRQRYLQTDLRLVQKADLVSQYNQFVNLLAMNIKLEKTQDEKLKNERKLLGQGRSSIYQVLQFELDLARAQAGKFVLALDLEKLQQQLKLNKYETYE